MQPNTCGRQKLGQLGEVQTAACSITTQESSTSELGGMDSQASRASTGGGKDADISDDVAKSGRNARWVCRWVCAMGKAHTHRDHLNTVWPACCCRGAAGKAGLSNSMALPGFSRILKDKDRCGQQVARHSRTWQPSSLRRAIADHSACLDGTVHAPCCRC